MLLVHGGAWDIPDSVLADHRDGLRKAVARGRECLLDGKAALDTVTAVVATLEGHGAFDAGFGAMLNQDGGPSSTPVLWMGRRWRTAP